MNCISSSIEFNMKSTLVLAILLTAIVSIDGSCEGCLEIFTTYELVAISDMFVGFQLQIATQVACPTCNFDRPIEECECAEPILYYWPTLAQALYPVFLQPERVCGIVGACEYSTDDEPTCEEVASWFKNLFLNMIEDDSIAERIEFLKGEPYCNGEQKCVGFIDKYYAFIHVELALTMYVEWSNYIENNC